MALCEIGVFPESEDNYLDMVALRGADAKERNAKIRAYIGRIYADNYVDACRYCSGKSCLNWHDLVPPAEQASGLLRLDKLTH
jgi:hypothetical protein